MMKRLLIIGAIIFCAIVFLLIAGYYRDKKITKITLIESDTVNDTTKKNSVPNKTGINKRTVTTDITTSFDKIDTKNISADSIVSFAETLIGIPYKYASSSLDSGFDCSGFITYVFNHFNINVPRSSIDFTNVGEEISIRDSKKGDLILFTGTDSTEKFVGHMGIITQNDNTDIQFIHSSSGKANGVVITPMSDYYKKRFVKVIRVNPSPL